MTSRDGIRAVGISVVPSSNMKPPDAASVEEEYEEPWLIDIKSSAGLASCPIVLENNIFVIKALKILLA